MESLSQAGAARAPEEEGREGPTARDIDVLYRESDRLYYELARGCGLTDTAYWILYQVVFSGGMISQRALVQILSYTRQTVNTSVKALEAKGLVGLAFEEGSRKCKTVVLTEAGWQFCQKKIIPAMEAEGRAFQSLAADDRRQFVRLVKAYTDAMDRELESLRAQQEGDAAREEDERL